MNRSKKINQLFEKRIDFINNENYKLPEEIYTCDKWSISSFQILKEELNKTKSLLNQFNLEEWSKHTKHRDSSSYIIRFVKQKFSPELVTQAWCKFYECVSTYPIISKDAINSGYFTSLHLCEAPGAFVSALNHYIASHDLVLEWKWCANSLNPDYEGNSLQEMIPDDRLLRHTYDNWYFGLDFSGNILKFYNHTNLLEKISDKVWLVTSDGSVDCSLDPGNQESHVEFLHYCETITAFASLRNGGNFVLKIFTMFEDSTICLLYLLNVVFKKVSIFKPASSKSGNSEVYVICLYFKGTNLLEKIWDQLIQPYKNGYFDPKKSMFDLNTIDKDFLNQLLKMSTYFMKKQTEKINDNIAHFKNETRNEMARLHQIKISVANRYINKYKLKVIPENRKLVRNFDVSQFVINTTQKFKFSNGAVKLKLKNLIDVCINSDILNIKLGERISEVQSSRFCTKENLSKFNSKYIQKTGPLYQNLRNLISKSTTIISLNDCIFDTYHEFQKYFFYKIFNSNESNFLIMKVPLITNFLVALVFILMSSYNDFYVHKSGFMVMCHPNQNSLINVKKILEILDYSYRSVKDFREFSCDIVQIVSPNLFYNNNFFEIIWNYNNIVFSNF